MAFIYTFSIFTVWILFSGAVLMLFGKSDERQTGWPAGRSMHPLSAPCFGPSVSPDFRGFRALTGQPKTTEVIGASCKRENLAQPPGTCC